MDTPFVNNRLLMQAIARMANVDLSHATHMVLVVPLKGELPKLYVQTFLDQERTMKELPDLNSELQVVHTDQPVLVDEKGNVTVSDGRKVKAERAVIDGGAPRDSTSMHNKVFRTKAPAEFIEVKVPVCSRPPHGYFCTRGEGHEGPCAAYPSSQIVEEQ